MWSRSPRYSSGLRTSTRGRPPHREGADAPDRVGGPPVVLVAVEDDPGIRIPPLLPEEPLDRLAVHVVAHPRVIEILDPVQLECAGDVPGVVEEQVFVGLEQPDRGVGPVLRDPFRRDQHVGVGISPSLDRQRHWGPEPPRRSSSTLSTTSLTSPWTMVRRTSMVSSPRSRGCLRSFSKRMICPRKTAAWRSSSSGSSGSAGPSSTARS